MAFPCDGGDGPGAGRRKGHAAAKVDAAEREDGDVGSPAPGLDKNPVPEKPPDTARVSVLNARTGREVQRAERA